MILNADRGMRPPRPGFRSFQGPSRLCAEERQITLASTRRGARTRRWVGVATSSFFASVLGLGLCKLPWQLLGSHWSLDRLMLNRLSLKAAVGGP